MTQPEPQQLTPAEDAIVIERILRRFVEAGRQEYEAITELCGELKRTNPTLSEKARQAIADIRATAGDKRDDAVEAAKRLSLANQIVQGHRSGEPVPRRSVAPLSALADSAQIAIGLMALAGTLIGFAVIIALAMR
jgi:hypothetical protein